MRLYTAAPRSPKHLSLSLEAKGLYWDCLGYSGGSEDEGFVPEAYVTLVTRDSVTARDTLVSALVTVGVWDVCAGGWCIHNYDDRQGLPDHRREAARIRQQRHRERLKAESVTVTPVTRDESVTSHREEKNRNREEKKLTPKPPTGDVLVVWQAWLDSTGRKTCKLDDKRKRLIGARLADYSLDDVLDAVRGWERDPWDGRKQQNELAILLRDSAHLEKFRDLWRTAPSNGHAFVDESYTGPSELARKFW